MPVPNAPESPTPVTPPVAPPASPEALPAGLDFAKLVNFDGIKNIMEKLDKGDWAGMVGAIMTMYKEVFGTPEEKAEIAKARAQGNLDTLQTDVDKNKAAGDKEGAKDDKEEVQLAENPRLGDGSDTVCIGDSAAHGMQMTKEWEKKPSFIGKDGMSTSWIKEHLKAEKERLKNKKKAIIYCAANNLFNDSAEDIVKHLVEMAKTCHEAGIPEIIVSSQLPADPRRSKLSELIKKNAELRDELIAAYKRGDFPAGTRVVDLTSVFSNEKGEMKEVYVDRTSNDPLHPYSAYGPALDYMMRTDSSKTV